MSIIEPVSDYSPAAAPGDLIELAVPAGEKGARLDLVLSRLLPGYSRTRLARWIQAGCVTIDGEPAVPSRRMLGGERLRLAPAAEPAQARAAAEPIPLAIVYEDTALLVVDKPAGLVVHPGAGNWSGTLLNALLAYAPGIEALPRAGIVHRLDKDTSGLLVVARTAASQLDLVRQLAARTVKREYLAIVHGKVDRGGTIDAPVGRDPRHRTRMAVTQRGRPAVTHFEVVERYSAASLLRCRLETGRTHQIRVHLQSAGHPLVGDPTYGARHGAARFGRQALHAERLALVHPVTQNLVEWQAPLPEDMRALISGLRAPQGPARRGQRAARERRQRS